MQSSEKSLIYYVYIAFLSQKLYFDGVKLLYKACLKWSGPLYRSKKKFFKVHLVGTLNLCLKMPEKMQKTGKESDHP